MPKQNDGASRTQIIVALIGMIGVIAAALIASMNKWWPVPPTNNNLMPSNINAPPSPTINPIPPKGLPGCLAGEFAGAPWIELRTSQKLAATDELTIVYVQHQIPIGAIKLRSTPSLQPDQWIFELEKAVEVVNSQCHDVRELSNEQGPTGDKIFTWKNYNYLRIQFGDQHYRLRFEGNGNLIEAHFLTQ